MKIIKFKYIVCNIIFYINLILITLFFSMLILIDIRGSVGGLYFPHTTKEKLLDYLSYRIFLLKQGFKIYFFPILLLLFSRIRLKVLKRKIVSDNINT